MSWFLGHIPETFPGPNVRMADKPLNAESTASTNFWPNPDKFMNLNMINVFYRAQKQTP
jgi:hypothetical protein